MEPPSRKHRWAYRAAIALIALAATFASYSYGAPPASNGPGVALGWPALLHVERAAAFLGVVSLGALVGWRASMGRLPIKIPYLEYEAELARETDEALGRLEQRLDQLERKVEELGADGDGV